MRKIILRGNDGKITLKQVGRRGPQGVPGEGVPTGGTTGQVPVKQSSTDFDIAWETPPAAPVTSVNGQTGVVVLDAGDVGADAAGSATQALADANQYTDTAVAGVDTGVMTVVAGDNVTVDNTDPANPIVSAADAPAAPVTSVNGRTGDVTGLAEQSNLTAHVDNTNNPHNVTKSQVGLSNVDNTSDADKPISTATQTALDLKLDASRMLQGTGFPNGVVTAPVGTIYVDTNITSGASSWIKKSGAGNTGWVALEGDTGPRGVGGLVTNGWSVVNNNRVILQRNGNVVHLTAEQLNADSATSAVPMEGILLNGFMPRLIQRNLATRIDASGTNLRYSLSDSSGNLTFGNSTTGNWSLAATFITNDPWPSTLPGTPA